MVVSSRPDGETKKVKAFWILLLSIPSKEYYFGFLFMQLDLTRFKPMLDYFQHKQGLPLCFTMNDYIIRIPLKRLFGMIFLHPLVKDYMQKYICQQRTDYPALRCSR